MRKSMNKVLVSQDVYIASYYNARKQHAVFVYSTLVLHAIIIL